jgi:hypothetical protein
MNGMKERSEAREVKPWPRGIRLQAIFLERKSNAKIKNK